MRPDSLHDEHFDDPDQDTDVDADAAPERPTSRAEQLCARRRLEDLLEERRLRRDIEDDWDLDDEEE